MKSTNFFMILMLATLLIVVRTKAQEKSPSIDSEREIIVMFNANTLTEPKSKSYGKLDEFIISSEHAKSLLKDFNVEFISKLIPHFKESDRHFKNKNGEEVILHDWSSVYLILLPKQGNKLELIEKLKLLPEVVYAEINGKGEADFVPNDQYFNRQWTLKNDGTTLQGSGTPGADIKAAQAWDIITGSNAIKIGIVDGGMQTNHPDFIGRVTGDAGDNRGHGTAVAGIAAAQGNNAQGIAGIAWNVGIINEDYGAASDADFANAVRSAATLGANVINNSWKLVPIGRYSETVRAAFSDVYKMNRVAVASMGNQYGQVIQYPAAFGQGIITVGATTNTDIRADYSSTGNHIDVSAPGGGGFGNANQTEDYIYSTVPGSSYDYFIDGYPIEGTSFSAPIATGITALLFSYNANLYNDDIEQLIRISADDKGPTGWDQEYGTGRVNAYKALQFLQAPYQLSQLSTYGGTDYGSSDYYQMIIYGAAGLSDGRYFVKRHEVRKTVSFSPMYDHYAWGRGVGTNGWSMENPNFAMGFCEVVPGTLTTNSVTLRTYVYEIWDATGQWKWYPTTASNVSLNYTVLGKQLIAPVISSFTQTPNPIPPDVTGTVVAVLSQGNGPITYSWSYANKPTWVTVSFSGITAYVTNNLALAKISGTEQIMAPPFSLTCIASNGAGSSTQTYYPSLSTSLSKDLSNSSNSLIITETKLQPNYPNPFNPSTVIKYQLKDKTQVTLKVYDIMGREIQTLVNLFQEAGYYEISFNGENLSSGIYFYTISAGKYFASKKMLLIK